MTLRFRCTLGTWSGDLVEPKLHSKMRHRPGAVGLKSESSMASGEASAIREYLECRQCLLAGGWCERCVALWQAASLYEGKVDVAFRVFRQAARDNLEDGLEGLPVGQTQEASPCTPPGLPVQAEDTAIEDLLFKHAQAMNLDLQCLLTLQTCSVDDFIYGLDNAEIAEVCGNRGLQLKERLLGVRERQIKRGKKQCFGREDINHANSMEERGTVPRIVDAVPSRVQIQAAFMQLRPKAAPKRSAGLAVPTAEPVAGEEEQSDRLAGQLLCVLKKNATLSALLEDPVGSQQADKSLEWIRIEVASHAPGTLAQALRSWRRWCEWCDSQTPPEERLPARASALNNFAHSVGAGAGVDRSNSGGRSAAENALAGLTFLKGHLGLPINIDKKRAMAGIRKRNGGITHGAPPISPIELWRLEQWAVSKEEIKAYLAMSACLLIYGCVRFRHAQRSMPPAFADMMWMTTCSKNKARQGGIPGDPYKWVVPQDGVWVQKLADKFRKAAMKFGLEKSYFMIPQIAPKGTTLEKATGFTDRRMSHNAFQRILQQLVAYGPCERKTAANIRKTTHSLRRTLPAIAQLTDMPSHKRLALGNWKENVAGVADLAVGSMTNRYISEEIKDAAQLDAKTALVNAMRKALAGSFVQAHPSLEWHHEELRRRLAGQCEHAQRGGTLCKSETRDTHDHSDNEMAHEVAAEDAATKKDDDSTTTILPSTSSSSETSRSSSSSRENARRLTSAEAQWPHLAWVTAASGPGKLHRQDPAKSSAAKCGVSTSGEVATGTGPQSAVEAFGAHIWCRRCAGDLAKFFEK